MDADPMTLKQQLEAAMPEGWLDADLEMEGLQLMDPPEPVHSHHSYTALHAAAAAGQLEEVQQLLASGADVNARTAGRSTPLHLAAREDHRAVAAELLLSGAACDAQDSKGRTPLHVAAIWGSKDTMAQLLKGWASLHAFDARGNQPLHLACSHGWAGAARLLLAGGAPVNQQRSGRTVHDASGAAERSDSDGYTPLHAACDRSKVEVVRALLEAGAQVNARCQQGCTPLWVAAKRGRLHVLEELLSAGADSSILDKEGWGPLHAACKHNCIRAVRHLLQLPDVLVTVDAPTHSGATPVWLAAASGHSEVVSLLVDAGADIRRQWSRGQTPLHAAFANKHMEAAQQLVAGGADINSKSASGQTFLHTAIRRNRLADVKQLLALGADPGVLDASGCKCLQFAAAAGHTPILEALLEAVARGQGTAGIDDMAQGMTALHWAVEQKRWDCAEVLVAAGADASKLYGPRAIINDHFGRKDLSGASALHRAVQLGAGVAVPLLATPTTLRHQWKGQTPLHLAIALTGHTDQVVLGILRALLAAGARPGLPDQNGTTALSLAASSNKCEVRELVASMVRTECVLYQQQEGQGRQQQQGIPVPQLATVLAAAAEAMHALLASGRLSQCVFCIRAVMEVLGLTAASNCLRQLFEEKCATGATALLVGYGALLGGILSLSWLAALPPIMWRGRLISKLQALVVQPLQQRLQPLEGQGLGEGSATAAAAAAAVGGQATAEEVYAEGAAAAQSEQWGLVVQSMNQLVTVHASEEHVSRLLAALSPASWSSVADLCEALLAACWEAQHEGAARARRELTEAVVATVQAWQQATQGAPPAVVLGKSGRRLG